LGVMVFRGFALWIIVPAVFLIWLLLAPIRALRRILGIGRPARLRQYVTWADECFIAILERTVLRPLGIRQPWPRWPKRDDVQAETSLLDAV